MQFFRLFLLRKDKKISIFWRRRSVESADIVAIYIHIHVLRAAKTRRGERKCKNNFGFFSCNCSIVEEASYDFCSRRYARTGFTNFFFVSDPKDPLFLYIFFV